MVDKQSQISKSILQTIIYSDVFDYPLTKEEIWRFLISEKPIQRKEFEEELNKVSGAKLVHLEGGNFYCFLGLKEIVKIRVKRAEESKKKIISAKKIIRYLSFIPTVLFIGISGGLALENAEKKDDIDLFIITSKNSLWITRSFLVLLLILMGQYRGRGNPPAGGEANKICLNMLIDEKALLFEKDRQNLYTAHEIAQLKPMFNRNDIYQKFVSVNRWVDKFLPNARIKNPNNAFASRGKHELGVKKKRSLFFIFHFSFFIFERLAKALQLWYMKRHRTKETIEDHFLAFHPFDYKSFVLKKYNKRLNKYEI